MAIRIGSAATRRQFLAMTAAATTFNLIGGIARPFISRAGDRPAITHGIQSGDVSGDSGVVWARTDRPARMLVEIATTESFKDVRSSAFVDALPETDFTAKLLVENLPADQDIFYRVQFQDLASPTISGEAQVGRFPHGTHRSPFDQFRLVRRHGGPGMGDRREPWWHAYLHNNAEKPPGFLHSQRRQYLCRRSYSR